MAASVLCVNEARAEIEENYKMDFNKPISTTAHDFKVGSGWGHLVEKATFYDDYPYDKTDEYVKYSYTSTDGRDASGALMVGSQKLTGGYDSKEVKDLIITPAITGKSSIYVKNTLSYMTSTIEFYAVTFKDGKYVVGNKLEVEVPKTFADWTKIDIPEQNNQLIGIRAHYLYLDDFAADKADIQLQKSLLITKVDYKGKSEVDCDAEGNFPITYEVSITNNGDVDLTEGTKGYSLSVKNYSVDNAVVFTQQLKGNLAVGASTTVTVSGTANCNTYPKYNRYDVYEDLTNTSKFGSWIEPIPYKPVLTMRDSDGKIENGKATYAWGMVKESTEKTFEIRNDGPAPLKVTSVVVPDGFTTSLTAPLTLEGHTKQQFTITMPATTPGIYSGEFKVSAEGVDDFKFNVSATVLDPSKYYVNFNDNKIPEGSYVEAGWEVKQRDAESSDNPYLLANGSQDTDNKFVTPLLKVAQGEKMTVDVARSNYSTYGDGVYLNIYYSADRTNWTLARKITAGELSDERAVNYNYYYSKLKTFVIDNIPAGNYYIGFGAGYTAIDNVYGFEKVDVAHDLMLAASYMPKTAVVNNAYTATATLRNINAKEEAADSYTASLYFDGEVVATAPAKAIAGGADVDFTFSYTPHKVGAVEAYIEFKNTADNFTLTTEKVSVDVKEEQAVSVLTVGAGNTTDKRTAIYWYDANSNGGANVDNLYTAEMLSKYGVKKGAKITSIEFTGNSIAEKTISNVNLTAYVGAVDATSFEAGKNFETLQKVEVYKDETIAFEYQKEFTTTITLAEPIVWDGESAIRVLTCVNATGWGNVDYNAEDTYKTSYSATGVLDGTLSFSEKPIAVAEFGIQADPSTMSGKITWKDKAVAGATVTLTSGDVIYTGESNDEGAYSINVIQSDKKYHLTVAAPGYIDYAEKDSVEFSGNVAKDIALEVEPVALTVGEDGNALFSATRAIDFSLTPDVEAYVVTAVNGNYTELAPVTAVPAGTGVLVKAKAGNYSLNVVPEADAVAKNLLVATAEEYTVAASDVKKVWTLGTDTKKNVPCFVSVEGTVVPAGSAYLAAAAEVPYIYLDKASGISGINAAAGLDTKAPMYNLAGQKVNASYKGIIIQNGKKFNNK